MRVYKDREPTHSTMINYVANDDNCIDLDEYLPLIVMNHDQLQQLVGISSTYLQEFDFLERFIQSPAVDRLARSEHYE
ncbi:hypothetical protein I4U23_015234 [Adineta vaga]|nr:hypothetical protein I4U23_015234 [Adineta vaga]